MSITAIAIKGVKLSVLYQYSKGQGKFIYIIVVCTAAVDIGTDMALIAFTYIL